MILLSKVILSILLLAAIIFVGILSAQLIWRSKGTLPFDLSSKDIISIGINAVLLISAVMTIALMMQQTNLMLQQIQQSFKLADDDRESQRLNRVQDEIALLRALDAEIANNRRLFDKLISDKDKFKDGENIHFMNYSTNALSENITRNTLRFDSDLLRRLFELYDFFEMSNNIFAETRAAGTKKEARKAHFVQLLRDHEQNLLFYTTIVNDLCKYMNFYEGFSSLQTKTTIEEGTALVAYPDNNQLVVNNFGGETAHHISITVTFSGLLNPPLFDPMNGEQALASQLSMKYPLPIPLNPISEVKAEGSLRYTSKHLAGFKEEKFILRWETTKWILQSTSSPSIKVENGKISTEIGKVPY